MAAAKKSTSKTQAIEMDVDKLYAIARRQTHAARPTTAPAGGASHEKPSRTVTKHGANGVDIEEELARRERIRNDDAEQDIALKRSTLNRLFLFLTVETALIFVFALMQGIGRPGGFHLDDWSFRVVVGATIAQITGMLFVAVRYLFPSKKE